MHHQPSGKAAKGAPTDDRPSSPCHPPRHSIPLIKFHFIMENIDVCAPAAGRPCVQPPSATKLQTSAGVGRDTRLDAAKNSDPLFTSERHKREASQWMIFGLLLLPGNFIK